MSLVVGWWLDWLLLRRQEDGSQEYGSQEELDGGLTGFCGGEHEPEEGTEEVRKEIGVEWRNWSAENQNQNLDCIGTAKPG